MEYPRPKVLDGVVLLGSISLMGAPNVFPHLTELVSQLLFWGGLGLMVIFVAVRWGGLLLKIASGQSDGGGHDNRGSAYAGRDNTGSQQVFHGPVTIHEVIHNALDAVPVVERMAPIKTTSTKPVPDMSISDVFFHIMPDVLDEPKENRWLKVGRDLRDKLSTHELVAWGRHIDPISKHHSALAEIPARYWVRSEFVYFFLDKTQGDDKPHSWTPGNSPTKNDYADIRFNRAQIFKIWPAAETAPLKVGRDRPLRDALMFATTGVWGERPMDKSEVLGRYAEKLREFRQKAFDGQLTVWGKSSQFGSGVWEIIPSAYWKDGVVDFLEALKEKSKTEREGGLFNPEFVIYYEVMVSRAEFEREFSSA